MITTAARGWCGFFPVLTDERSLWPAIVVGLWLSAFALGSSNAESTVKPGSESSRRGEAESSRATLDQRMRQRVDELIAAKWTEAGVEPVETCGDEEFLRRVYLDLVGRIPRVSEIREFFATDPDRRRTELVSDLVRRPSHATHLTNTWKRFLLPQGTDLDQFGGAAGFDDWIRGRFAENVPYDQLATDLLLAEGEPSQSGPTLFYAVQELQPEKLAASTSRALLGVQLQCAQCHDHPFDRWTQKDFWGYAAFFGRVEAYAPGQNLLQGVREARTGEVRLPGTDQIAAPRFLGHAAEVPRDGDVAANVSRRELLARWLVDRGNPYFRRAAVNRVWAHLFGRGIVDPPDDMGEHNPPSHPTLLDELAAYFGNVNFDLRRLFELITSTRAYQLTSADTDHAHRPAKFFARMSLKTLTPEQLYDSLAVATCRRHSSEFNGPTFGLNRFTDERRQAFLDRFRSPSNDLTEFQAGIPQALSLMNGQLVGSATGLEESDILNAINAPFFDDRERVEILFLSVLTRRPSDAERRQFLAYVQAGESPEERLRAFSDMLWALLNSAEFVLNH